MNNSNKSFKTSWFYKLFLNSHFATSLAVILLLLLNIFLISKMGFIFSPIFKFLGIIFVPVILATVFYYLLNPVVNFLEKKGVKRTWAILLVFLLFLAAIIVGLAVIIPSLVRHIESFSNNFPTYLKNAEHSINNLLKDPFFKEYRPQMEEFLNNLSDSLISFSKNMSKGLVNGVSGFLSKATDVLLAVVIVPFILFYLLRDGRTIKEKFIYFLPTKWRKNTSDLLGDINHQLTSYVKGQVTVAFAVAVMLSVGFSVIGLKYGVTIGIIGGFLNLIPYLGTTIAVVMALLVAVATSPIMVVKVIIIFVLEQFIEGHFISPLVLGNQLNIHPVTILIVLLTSGKLFGVWGVLLGIPVYVSLKVVITYIYRWYRKHSGLYDDSDTNKNQTDTSSDEQVQKGAN